MLVKNVEFLSQEKGDFGAGGGKRCDVRCVTFRLQGRAAHDMTFFPHC